VVFDIGTVARDNEHIHGAALRQLQARLGYCSKDCLVAQWELKLERDGQWDEFLKVAKKTLGKPWQEAKEETQADHHFSHVLHELMPKRYETPTAWLLSEGGSDSVKGASVKEVLDDMEAMLSIRAQGKTLFLVIDEVSQYVHQDDDRMLKLQSFVPDLGKRLKGMVWIFATGQQKLEDTGDTVHIGKLKDRFPPALRVHLSATNIRDVVHKRLLKKKPNKESLLRELFQKHRSDLKLYGYGCEEITEEDFIEVYPMLPGHVDLLLQVTSALRTHSSRVQGDAHAIRGLLQLLGELFRAQKLADREVGELVTLDAIYEVQHTALDPDVQSALTRIFNHPAFRDDALAQSAARAVALLELVQEQMPTTDELVAKCLYRKLGLGNRKQAVGEALGRLRDANLLGHSEKQGYRIQSSAGQEWERERRDVSVTPDKRSELVQEKLQELIGTPDRPRYKGNPFPFTAFYSDGRGIADKRLQDARTGAAVTFDFRFLSDKEERAAGVWAKRSDQDPLRDRIVWLVGDQGLMHETARELCQSRYMVKRNAGQYESLRPEKKRLLAEEQGRAGDLEIRLREAVDEAFCDGAIYFRGGSMKPSDFGPTFAIALTVVAKRWLPDLFPHFTEIAVTDTELNQLLEPHLSGPSTKFMEEGLGILSLDSGKYSPTCTGNVPSRIMEYLKGAGASGSTLMTHFSKPPYGYPADVIGACLAGLLRARKIRIRPEERAEITSVRDPGAKDLFRKVKEGLARADIVPAGDTEVNQRDRIAICNFFKDHFTLDLDRENDAIADAVFAQFPGRREALRKVEARLGSLPDRREPPPAPIKLGKALEDCMRDRHIEAIVIAVKRNLDILRDGIEQLAIIQLDLTDDLIELVKAAMEVRDHHLEQLKSIKEDGEVSDDANALVDHLNTDRPWRDMGAIEAVLDKIRKRYTEERRRQMAEQRQQAEQAEARVKTRDGFDKLDADQSH
jgi:hypothetical protein